MTTALCRLESSAVAVEPSHGKHANYWQSGEVGAAELFFFLSVDKTSGRLGCCGWLFVLISFLFVILLFPLAIFLCVKVEYVLITLWCVFSSPIQTKSVQLLHTNPSDYIYWLTCVTDLRCVEATGGTKHNLIRSTFFMTFQMWRV